MGCEIWAPGSVLPIVVDRICEQCELAGQAAGVGETRLLMPAWVVSTRCLLIVLLYTCSTEDIRRLYLHGGFGWPRYSVQIMLLKKARAMATLFGR
jgi:hypothetical protein